MGIINNEIPYMPGSEYEQEEDVVSSFPNLDGGTEIVDDQEGEGTDIVDGGQPSTNGDLELQVATTSGAEVYIYIEPLVIQTYLNVNTYVLTRATLFLFLALGRIEYDKAWQIQGDENRRNICH